jgi:hypothetical protein
MYMTEHILNCWTYQAQTVTAWAPLHIFVMRSFRPIGHSYVFAATLLCKSHTHCLAQDNAPLDDGNICHVSLKSSTRDWNGLCFALCETHAAHDTHIVRTAKQASQTADDDLDEMHKTVSYYHILHQYINEVTAHAATAYTIMADGTKPEM